jgi:hypothetical protein
MNDKSAFVLAGFVIEGKIAAGMQVRVPFLATVLATAPIDDVQSLHQPDGDVTCLCLRCTDPQEATLWEALKIKDRTVEIIEAV